MKKLLPFLGCLLLVCPAAQVRGAARPAPDARVKTESLPEFKANTSLSEAIAQELARKNGETRDKIKLEGCRPFWNKHPQQMMAIPKLADQACEAFKKSGRDCFTLGSYVYRQAKHEIAGRNGNRLLAGFRQGFINDPDEIDFILKLQDHLILGIAPAVITFMPQKYWIHSVGQSYDFCLQADVTSERYYRIACDRSLPVIEEKLREIIANGGPLY